MGAWGINTFENDVAMDWLCEFMEDPSESRILAAFSAEPAVMKPSFIGKLMGKKALSITPELEGEEVLAAAEVVATLQGRSSESNPDELAKLPKMDLGGDTVLKALEAIKTITANSNLKDCWEETDDYQAWQKEVDDICRRLQN